MAKWIFLKDYDTEEKLDQAINLDFVTHFNLSLEEKNIVIFFGGTHDDPHIIKFENQSACQKAYDAIICMLKKET